MGAGWRRAAMGVAAAVVLVAVAVAGYRLGARREEAATPTRDAPRLRVAAWVQTWADVSAEPVTELHVTPDGRGAACSKDEPCSLVGARDLLRGGGAHADTDVVVTVGPGEYPMTEPLVLDARDSGRGGHRVVYRAAPGAPAVLQAGRSVTGWAPAEGRPGVYVADVAAPAEARQLFVGGERAVRARGPMRPTGWTRTDDGFLAPDDAISAWPDASGLEVVSYAEWKALRCSVVSVSGRALVLEQPCWSNANAHERFGMGEVTWIENALELLDEPGEFYLDGTAGRLYYRPRDGQDLAATTAVLAGAPSVLEVRGSAAEPAHDIGIEGLTFAATGWTDASTSAGYASTQAGFHRGAASDRRDPLDIERTPGAVRVAHARHVRFAGNAFTGTGAVGLDLAAGSQDIGVIGNRFADTGSTAVQIGEVRQGAQNAAPVDQLDRIQVADNLVERPAAEFQDGVGIFVSYGSNVSILHNELHDLPYSGISLGWGWGTDSYARNNVVLGNRVTDAVQVLQDGGAIYTLSPMPGSVIERNHLVGQRNRSGALFLDEGTADVTVADNVVERAPRWLHMWQDSIHDVVVVDNASDTSEVLDASRDSTVARNHPDPATWPAAAHEVIAEAGLEPAFADLRAR